MRSLRKALPCPIRYAPRKAGSWTCLQIVGHTTRGEPNCQSIAGKPIADKAIGALGDREHDARGRRAGSGDPTRDRGSVPKRPISSRGRAIERAQIEADLAAGDLCWSIRITVSVADTLEGEWNNRLRALAEAREER